MARNFMAVESERRRRGTGRVQAERGENFAGRERDDDAASAGAPPAGRPSSAIAQARTKSHHARSHAREAHHRVVLAGLV